MSELEDRLKLLESEIERRLVERFAALRDEFDRLRLESDRRWEGFLSRFDQDFRGIVPAELLAGPAEPVEKPSEAAAFGSLSIESARALDDAENQVEVLHRFLDHSRRHASRIALLISRGGVLGVWKAVGFSDHGGSDEATRRVTLPAEPGGTLSRVMEGTPCRLAPGNDVSAGLGARDPADVVVIPMVVKEKVSGALYADAVAGEERRFDPQAIGLLTFLAGLAVDRLAARKLKPAPALRPAEPAGASAPSVEPAPALEEPETEPGFYGSRLGMREERVSAPAPPTAPEEEGETTSPPGPHPPALSPGPEPMPRPPESPAVTMRLDNLSEFAASRPAESASAAAPPRVSAGARRLAGPLAPPEGDERRDEARRFAKLLVSEIKLYNERAVQEGREHGNLYGRLKEDIDRSRQMYDERIPEDVRASSNFFYEELVRVLADGRAEVLGI